MICHVCGNQATGQCKNCGKFYCPDHGDVVCKTCSSAITAKPIPDRPTTPDAAAPKCYACSAEATTRCMWCNALSCAVHVQGVAVYDGYKGWSTALLCSACRAKGAENLQWHRAFSCGCAIIIVIVVVVAAMSVMH